MMKNRGAQSWEIGIVENTSGYTTNTRPGPARKHTHNITLWHQWSGQHEQLIMKILANKENQIFLGFGED